MITVDYTGKSVLVTGGSKSIGAAICCVYAKCGADIIVNYRSHEDESEAFVKSLRDEFGVNAVGIKGDISKEEDVVKIFEKAKEQIGKVDILINNAGSHKLAHILDINLEEWNKYLDNNVTGMFLMSREFAKQNIAEKRSGNIVNILSKSAFYPTSKNNGYYVVNKTSELGLTKALAVELVEYGIYVNAVIPGFVNTDMIHCQSEERIASFMKRAPLHRFTEPEELGEAIAAITADNGKRLVGSIVDISGGIMLGY